RPFVPDSIINLIENAEADRASQTFVTREIVLSEDRFLVPRIIVDEGGEIISSNHVEDALNQELIEEYPWMNTPIETRLGEKGYSQRQYVYYGESPTRSEEHT